MLKFICDLEIHSKYAYAVSRSMDVPTIAQWAKLKGIDLVGTGDFTHPEWLAQLKALLEEDDSGLLKLKNQTNSLRFVLTAEVSSVFSQGGRARRVHTLIVAPNFATVEKINQQLSRFGRLSADGRPILKISCKELLAIVLEVNRQLKFGVNEGAFIIPAHVWTPWYGLFGSKSGFDSLVEAYEELSPFVRVIETGLSSDMPMNWRLSAHDSLALVSFSDAHSAINLGREATVVQLKSVNYVDLSIALQNPRKSQAEQNAIVETYEFFPQEGKYYYDGIAQQRLSLHPSETTEFKLNQPHLASRVTVGVLSRVNDLADRATDYLPTNRPPFRSLVPLVDLIAASFGQRKQTKKVLITYMSLIAQCPEFKILTDLPKNELLKLTDPKIATAILAVRQGEVKLTPGYDGIYGIVELLKK